LTITIKACSKYQKDGEYNYHAALEIELVCEHHPTIHLYDPIGSIDPFTTEQQAMSSAEAWLGKIAKQFGRDHARGFFGISGLGEDRRMDYWNYWMRILLTALKIPS
jgi:hypothetical protein